LVGAGGYQKTKDEKLMSTKVKGPTLATFNGGGGLELERIKASANKAKGGHTPYPKSRGASI